MQPTIIRDSKGNLFATIDADESGISGDLVLQRGSRVIGRYRKQQNETFNERGQKIGDGDRLHELLGYGYFYVYALVDPRQNNKPFYVGKGTVNRALAHMNRSDEGEDGINQVSEDQVGLEPEGIPDLGPVEETTKLQMIQDIRRAGYSDRDMVRVICRRVSNDVALAVESCLIKSVYGLHNLKNICHGHQPERFRQYGDGYVWKKDFDLDINSDKVFNPDDGRHPCGPYYVYALIDPRNQNIFYVGKGTGARIRDHFRLAAGGATDPRYVTIRDIVADGHCETDIARVVARVSSEHIAYMLESLYINFVVGCSNLHNQQGGHQSGLFRAKDDWALRQGFDIPIIVKKGQRRVELLDQFLGQGLDIMLHQVRDELLKVPSCSGLLFSPPTASGSGELVIDALVEDKVHLRIQTRSAMTGTFNTILEPRGNKQKKWINHHFSSLGKSHYLRGDQWFNCRSWSVKNLTTDVREAVRRASLLVKLISINDVGGLSAAEQNELFP